MNDYFDAMAEAVWSHGGEILKFMGDAMLVVFRIDDQRSAQDACWQAVAAGTTALDDLKRLSRQARAQGFAPLSAGIAVHLGEVVYGNIGASRRLDFTVMGHAVNVVARLQTLTAKLDRPLLLSTCGGKSLSVAIWSRWVRSRSKASVSLWSSTPRRLANRDKDPGGSPVMALHLRTDVIARLSPVPQRNRDVTGAAVVTPDDYGACREVPQIVRRHFAEILFAGGDPIRHVRVHPGEELTRFAVDDVGDCVVAVPRGAPPAGFARRIARNRLTKSRRSRAAQRRSAARGCQTRTESASQGCSAPGWGRSFAATGICPNLVQEIVLNMGRQIRQVDVEARTDRIGHVVSPL